MKVGILEFPGSTCAQDTATAFATLGVETEMLNHQMEHFRGLDLLVIPGGSAFGDFLRPGALTRLSSAAAATRRFAKSGGKILGIGNGFQILCELGLLPGILLRNPTQQFRSAECFVRFEGGKSFLSQQIKVGQVIRLPLACYYGCYYTERRYLRELKEQELITFRYCEEDGSYSDECNIVGALESIAAISSTDGNIVGMMVHPERAIEAMFGGVDGLKILKGAVGI